MRVAASKQIARRWVTEEVGALPAFGGAFHTGSTHWLPDDAEVPRESDVDVMVVIDRAQVGMPRPGKRAYRGLLLDISYVGAGRVRDPGTVLGDYHLAGAFRTNGIILDPTGQLSRLQPIVAENFAKPDRVRRRCEDARDKVLRNLASINDARPFHENVSSWLFAAGVTAHVLLVAGLRNPTVRRRYVAARELLADHGRLDFYPELLDLLGCAQMSRERVEHHLAALEHAFDAAASVIRTPVFFASDLSPIARPIAIDGSRELIERGLHRDAVFWIVATAARCQQVLHADAPEELRRCFDADFSELLADLGVTSVADLHRRREQIRSFLPRLQQVADAIIVAAPSIRH